MLSSCNAHSPFIYIFPLCYFNSNFLKKDSPSKITVLATVLSCQTSFSHFSSLAICHGLFKRDIYESKCTIAEKKFHTYAIDSLNTASPGRFTHRDEDMRYPEEYLKSKIQLCAIDWFMEFSIPIFIYRLQIQHFIKERKIINKLYDFGKHKSNLLQSCIGGNDDFATLLMNFPKNQTWKSILWPEIKQL